MKKCKLIIKDECNVKFEDLDVITRRKLADEVKFLLPYARHTPAFKLGRWDGMVRFCDIGGRTYFHLLDRLLPIVVEAGYEIDIQDHRISHSFEFDEIKEDTYSHVKWPEGHPAAGEPIVLRDYQVEALNKFLEHPQSIQEISTGAGKTIVTAALSQQVEKYGRSIIIVPSKDLVTQTEEDYINMGLDVGVFFGDRKEYGKMHTICTWQSLEALDKKSKKYDDSITVEDFIEDVICVMVDECFAPGTLVLTPNGYVPIETLSSGDKVINYSEDTDEYKEDTVVKLHKNLTHSQSEKMYEIEFDNGKKINVTGNHKFLTERGWVRADQLNETDEILSYEDK